MSILELPPLSLYVHIPWCVRKCPYCDFNSHQSEQDIPEQAYVQALLLDLEQELGLVQGRELQSVFFGGGTPSLLSAAAVRDLLEGIRRRVALQPDAEITLEANPGTAEAEKFKAFAGAGINRMSLGVQSFFDESLRSLGRIHDAEQAESAINMAKAAGLASFNIDLMHGLPGQSPAAAREDIERALSFSPPHISWYQLTLEPNTAFYTDPPRLPAESVLAGIQEQGELLLDTSGLAQYEVSAYATDGHRCRHNLNYWQFGDYLGIGAGAHSKLTDLSCARIVRFSRTRQPTDYLAQPSDQRRVSPRTLGPDDLRGEYMMNALRLRGGFTAHGFSARTGLPASALEPPLESLLERGLLEVDLQSIRATALGRRFLDSVVAEFFH